MNLSNLRGLGWQDLLLVGVILMYLFLQQGIISQYKSLPSPIYGGDYYFQLGSINHIRHGGNPLEAPNIPNSEPCYFILYSLLVAVFANLFNLESIQAIFGFSQLLIIISMPLFYFFMWYLFKDKNLALLGTVIYVPITLFPVLKYTEFTMILMMPLFFFSMLYFFRRRTVRSAIIAGIILGLCNISHSASLFVTALFVFIMFAYLGFFKYLSIRKTINGGNIRIKLNLNREDFRGNIVPTIKLFALLFLIGFLISLLYWYAPIFIYHGKTLNDMQNWAFEDFANPDFQTKYFRDIIYGYFLNFSSFKTSLISIFSILGILFLFGWFRREDKPQREYIALMFITSILGVFHYFLSEILLNTHFSPPRVASFIMYLSMSLLILFAFSNLVSRVGKYGKYLILVLVILLLFFQNVDLSKNIEDNRWHDAGKPPISEDFQEMQTWVLGNTDVNDVFLSTNELSFALNALTGRKLVISRRSHNSAFLDIDQREADAAIMLYGNDDSKRPELLRKYNVKYLYWNYYWIQSDYRIDESGRIISWFDPIILKDNPSYRAYLEKHGIRYLPQNTWLDPAMRSEYHRKLDLLFIVPEYRAFSQPWSEDLDEYLEPVWMYENNGQIIAKIYRINV